MFLKQVYIPTFVEGLSSSSVFTRGLLSIPKLQDPALMAVSEAVLCRSVVTDDDFADPGQRDVLLWCFRQGWLHADKIAGSDTVGYCFPSSPHHWFFEQKLLGTTLSTPVNTTSLLEFSVAIICKFSPQALANPRTVGPGFIQCLPGAQFQDEFYCCLRMYSWGSFTTLPEYATKSGWVDFYIPSKQWAIKLLHDGD